MPEEWKDIEGYEGWYQVSSHGNVRSWKNGSHGKRRIPKLISSGLTDKGYRRVFIRHDSIGRQHKHHRLVAEAFVPNPEGKPEVNHINGNKLDNRAENLEWCTRLENMLHAGRNGLLRPVRGERNNMARLTRSQVIEIRSLYRETGILQRELAKEYGVSEVSINNIINYRTWRHI